MKAAIVALALIVIAIAGVQLFQTGLASAGQQETIMDESFTPTAGTVQELDRSELNNTYYADSVIVDDENGNRSYEGTDYVWLETNGTIKPLAGGNLAGDASATIDYSYRQTTAEQRGVAQTLASIPNVLPYFALALFALAFVGLMRGL